jgi:putative protease
MLRIISPVDNLAEADRLLEAGADELYGGFVPAEWRERYSLLASLNQRTFETAQIASESDLAEIIRLVHARQRTFALTLNAPFYSDLQIPMLLDYVDRMVELGVDSIILADLGLLRCLRDRHPSLEYHGSTLAHLSNSGAVRFYAGQGMQRVILPRHLTTAEMSDIIREVPDVRCDAFLLVGKCPNTEGLCSFHHSSPDRIWPCEIPYRIESQIDGPSPGLADAIRRQASWSETDRRHGCGLCAIPALQRIGVYGLKLVGRGAPVLQKVRNIAMAREFISLACQEPDFLVYREKAMAAHRERFGSACSSNVCYYPEYFPGEDL